MGTFLQITGLAFLLTILLTGGIFCYFWIKGLKHADADPPSRIHLVPDSSPEWIKQEKVNKIISAFRSLDFAEAGAFCIEEMDNAKLFGLVHAREHMTVVVYQYEGVGVWSDLGIEYENGNMLVVSNLPRKKILDQRPGTRQIRESTLDEVRMFETAKQEREPGPYKTVSVESFSAQYEQVWARENDWRNSRGGPTQEEIRRVADMEDMELSDREIERAHRASCEGTIDRLDSECIEQFMSETEWENPVCFAIHDKIPVSLLFDYINERIFIPEDQTDEIEYLIDSLSPGMPVNKIFEQIVERVPENLRPRKAGEVSTPIRADIYSVSMDFETAQELMKKSSPAVYRIMKLIHKVSGMPNKFK